MESFHFGHYLISFTDVSICSLLVVRWIASRKDRQQVEYISMDLPRYCTWYLLIVDIIQPPSLVGWYWYAVLMMPAWEEEEEVGGGGRLGIVVEMDEILSSSEGSSQLNILRHHLVGRPRHYDTHTHTTFAQWRHLKILSYNIDTLWNQVGRLNVSNSRHFISSLSQMTNDGNFVFFCHSLLTFQQEERPTPRSKEE